MATKPSAPYDTPPAWATNANFAAGPNVGLPTKVEPPTAQTEDGWRPGERPPSQYANFFKHAVGLWLAWARDSIDFLDARFASGGVLFSARQAGIRYLGANAAMVDTDASWAELPDQLLCTADNGQCAFDLSRLIPRGQSARIDWVRILVNPGAARAPSDRISTRLVSQAYGVSFASPSVTPTVHSTEDDDGTTDLQWITHQFAPSSLDVVDPRWFLEVTCPDAGANSDTIYAVAVQVSAEGLAITS